LIFAHKDEDVNYGRYLPMRKNQKILGKIKKFSVMKTRKENLERKSGGLS